MRIAAARIALSRLIEDRRGGVTVVFALAAVAVLAFSALAIDASRVHLLRSRLIYAVDAAALSVGKRLGEIDDAALSELADGFVRANLPPGMLGIDRALGPQDLTVIVEDGPDATSKRIRAIATLRTAMIGVIDGRGTVDVRTEARVQRRTTGIELSLVLDVTGSMSAGSGTPGVSRLQALQQASTDLLDLLYGDAETVDHVSVAVVPFSATVNVEPFVGFVDQDYIAPTLPSGDVWIGGEPTFADLPLCVGDRETLALSESDTPPTSGPSLYPLEVAYQRVLVSLWPLRWGWRVQHGLCPAVPLLPLTAERSVVQERIDGLIATGNTRTDRGLHWGWQTVSANWQAHWPLGGAAPVPYGDPKIRKVVVMMTDGENTPASLRQAANDSLARQCESMKALGIEIMSVNFQTPESLYPLYRDCASSPELFFPAVTTAQLRDAFRNIGSHLTVLRLVE